MAATPTHLLLAFLVAAGLLTIAPGVDTIMVLRTALSAGRRRAAFAAAGIALGCLAWGGTVALGLGALLAASDVAFGVLKLVGAAYLAWLGVGLILRPRSKVVLTEAPRDGAATPGGATFLRRGFLTNILNPKVGVFYITFLPQFIPRGADVMAYSALLAAIHVALSVVWFCGLIFATAPLGALFATPGVARALDRLTGGVFIAFGATLALSKR